MYLPPSMTIYQDLYPFYPPTNSFPTLAPSPEHPVTRQTSSSPHHSYLLTLPLVLCYSLHHTTPMANTISPTPPHSCTSSAAAGPVQHPIQPPVTGPQPAAQLKQHYNSRGASPGPRDPLPRSRGRARELAPHGARLALNFSQRELTAIHRRAPLAPPPHEANSASDLVHPSSAQQAALTT